MAGAGVLAGAAFGVVVARLAGSYFLDVKMPGALPVVLSAFVLLTAAVVAAWLPAGRARRRGVSGAPRRLPPTLVLPRRPNKETPRAPPPATTEAIRVASLQFV